MDGATAFEWLSAHSARKCFSSTDNGSSRFLRLAKVDGCAICTVPRPTGVFWCAFRSTTMAEFAI
jgi:hypothetical protein